MKFCPLCGCQLVKTSYDRDWCPNCFKVIEKEPEEEYNKEANYIG